MIETLSIANYALIDSLELTFTPGLNIITGETGAGKSIMLGALSMLFGNRADTKVVTDKSKKSVVEATFSIAGYDSLRRLLAENDIDSDDSSIILRREINPAGRSRSFVNDQPVPLTLMREVAMHLVDIHSQHQNLLLSTPEYQLGIIDTLMPDQSVKEAYQKAYTAYRTALKRYQVARRALEADRTEQDYYRFRLDRLNELNLQPGEQQQLEQQRQLLANVAHLKQALAALTDTFTDADYNITDLLRQASNIAPQTAAIASLADLTDRIESLRIEALDIAQTIAEADSKLEDDPDLLQRVDDRLGEIYSLQHKFGVDSDEALIAMRSDLAQRLDDIDSGDEHLRELAQAARQAKKGALMAAQTLSDARKKVSDELSDRLCRAAKPLGMNNLVVDISLTPTDLAPQGADIAEFRFAFNKNQPLMPVKDTASGGEISRLMLCIKAIVADKIQLPSIIFDEVDTGVSGDIASRMGDMMKLISRQIQVIAITHLPTVAAKGDSHFKVYKTDSDLRTTTRVSRLARPARIAELALMLSGDSSNEAARRTAETLLDNANNQNIK